MKHNFLKSTFCLTLVFGICGSTLQAADSLHASREFYSSIQKADNKAATLIEAIQGEDDRLARLAFDLAAKGTESKATGAWLAKNILALPASRQLIGLNTLQALEASVSNSVIDQLSRKGKGAARAEAVRLLGTLGRKKDVNYLDSLLASDDSDLVEAASIALVNMPVATVRSYLNKNLKSEDIEEQARMIGIVAERGDSFAARQLWAIASQVSSPNQKTAIKALGTAAPTKDFVRALKELMKEADSPLKSSWQGTVWDLARRQTNYDNALSIIDRTKKNASGTTADLLASLGEKLSGLEPALSLQDVDNPEEASLKATSLLEEQGRSGPKVLLPGSYQDITPKRFEVAVYLDCGVRSSIEYDGITISRHKGVAIKSEAGTNPTLTVDYAEESLDYSITGLDASQDYILGMTWWDLGFQDRQQAVDINGEEVLPATRAIAYEEWPEVRDEKYKFRGNPTPTRIQFALRSDQIVNGRTQINIRRVEGPNVLNSELWIMKRTEKAAEKQVLLVSGQDYPGHYWRKTGAVMEDLITEDPRMEVTICETPYALGLEHLDVYDVVFIHFKNYEEYLPSTFAMRENIKEFVRNGGGLCLSHFACGAFQEWPEFVELSGRVWNGQGHDKRGPFIVKVVDEKHPVTRGLSDFEVDDELYFCLMGDPEVHLLCSAFSKVKQEEHAQAFVMQSGEGRVFLSTLGHDVRAYDSEGTPKLYRQGTVWAAGLE